jgi:hypothetical protein
LANGSLPILSNNKHIPQFKNGAQWQAVELAFVPYFMAAAMAGLVLHRIGKLAKIKKKGVFTG